jgi:6-phosphogluconolactonase
MPKHTTVIYRVFDDAEGLAAASAAAIAESAERAIANRGMARIAISGGSTPKRTFQMLADAGHPFRSRIDWERLHVFWADERCVPPDNPKSNFHNAWQDLLSKVPIPQQNICRIEGELPADEAAARYESSLRNRFRLEGAELPQFDFIMLGLGTNGHTASLFPYSEALDSLMHLAVSAHVDDVSPWRVSLTWPVINHASQVVFQVQDASKADVLHQVLQGPYQPEVLPSQLIRPQNGELTFLLDRAAAAKLPAPGPDRTGMLELTR